MGSAISVAGLALAIGVVSAAQAAEAPAYPGNQGDSWAAIAKLPSLTGVYELARGRDAPKDGRRDVHPVYEPAAAAQAKTYKDAQAKGLIEDAQSANCLPPGMPQIMDQPYPIQVLLTPGEVTIIQEAYMQVRHVHTDGRKHPADPNLTFNGDSIGHWEGDTLVVDTVGLAPEVVYENGVQHSPKEHIVEHISLANPNLLEIRARIEDPGVLAQPYEYVGRYARHPDWSLAEYICEQNNRNSVDANGKAGINLKLK
jgi:hypothetical protein